MNTKFLNYKKNSEKIRSSEKLRLSRKVYGKEKGKNQTRKEERHEKRGRQGIGVKMSPTSIFEGIIRNV